MSQAKDLLVHVSSTVNKCWLPHLGC